MKKMMDLKSKGVFCIFRTIKPEQNFDNLKVSEESVTEHYENTDKSSKLARKLFSDVTPQKPLKQDQPLIDNLKQISTYETTVLSFLYPIDNHPQCRNNIPKIPNPGP